MRHSRRVELLPIDPEIKHTFRRNLKMNLGIVFDSMAQQAKTKTIRDDFQQTVPTTQPGIVQAPFDINNFELKLVFI